MVIILFLGAVVIAALDKNATPPSQPHDESLAGGALPQFVKPPTPPPPPPAPPEISSLPDDKDLPHPTPQVTATSPVTAPSPSSESRTQAPAKAAENPLDTFMKTTEAKGVTVIDRYYIDDGALYIVLNEDTWESFDKEHAHRLCDLMAQSNFIDVMNVPVAYLTLDHGKTTVGNISHDGFSPYCAFKPNDDYWKFK